MRARTSSVKRDPLTGSERAPAAARRRRETRARSWCVTRRDPLCASGTARPWCERAPSCNRRRPVRIASRRRTGAPSARAAFAKRQSENAFFTVGKNKIKTKADDWAPYDNRRRDLLKSGQSHAVFLPPRDRIIVAMRRAERALQSRALASRRTEHQVRAFRVFTRSSRVSSPGARGSFPRVSPPRARVSRPDTVLSRPSGRVT